MPSQRFHPRLVHCEHALLGFDNHHNMHPPVPRLFFNHGNHLRDVTGGRQLAVSLDPLYGYADGEDGVRSGIWSRT